MLHSSSALSYIAHWRAHGQNSPTVRLFQVLGDNLGNTRLPNKGGDFEQIKNFGKRFGEKRERSRKLVEFLETNWEIS